MGADAPRHPWAAAVLAPRPGGRVLELGCGPGVTAAHVLPRLTGAGTLTAVDRSAAMLAQAARRNAAALVDGRLRLHRGEAGRDPLPDGPFDLAYAFNVAALWRSADVLAAVAAALVPQGRLAVLLDRPGGDARHAPAVEALRRRLPEAGLTVADVLVAPAAAGGAVAVLGHAAGP